jgi:hypothetical protein
MSIQCDCWIVYGIYLQKSAKKLNYLNAKILPITKFFKLYVHLYYFPTIANNIRFC